MAEENETDVLKALAAFGAAPVKYRTFGHVSPRPAPLAMPSTAPAAASETDIRSLPSRPAIVQPAETVIVPAGDSTVINLPTPEPCRPTQARRRYRSGRLNRRLRRPARLRRSRLRYL